MSNSGWQPIETAPRDGTEIIVGFDCATQWIVHMAFYRSESEIREMEGIGDWSMEDVGWWSYTLTSVGQERLDGYRTPTHWIPLPKVPIV
ncbi:hypothetical protein SAMN04487785_102403 [Dyella jiangningensis]|uniref:hypothetical protein n=1 Tax=Dyella sp. AtDHG13 TaxID=1938897 RepID=UPI00088D19A9|nr:hypothetical protein [Dyella sp. AtDHG13]PXV60675.1 hypothetical protein BDW41_102402 [Dyella sp. AtDHG13]SDJ54693.1 hypothetical protein SAMN04487785_102403 [Dyella jiangningensis]